MGIRAILNLGHTFGHAFEAATDFDEDILLHGEAVSLGIICAFIHSVKKGLCLEETYQHVRNHLETHHLPHQNFKNRKTFRIFSSTIPRPYVP